MVNLTYVKLKSNEKMDIVKQMPKGEAKIFGALFMDWLHGG